MNTRRTLYFHKLLRDEVDLLIQHINSPAWDGTFQDGKLFTLDGSGQVYQIANHEGVAEIRPRSFDSGVNEERLNHLYLTKAMLNTHNNCLMPNIEYVYFQQAKNDETYYTAGTLCVDEPVLLINPLMQEHHGILAIFLLQQIAMGLHHTQKNRIYSVHIPSVDVLGFVMLPWAFVYHEQKARDVSRTDKSPSIKFNLLAEKIGAGAVGTVWRCSHTVSLFVNEQLARLTIKPKTNKARICKIIQSELWITVNNHPKQRREAAEHEQQLMSKFPDLFRVKKLTESVHDGRKMYFLLSAFFPGVELLCANFKWSLVVTLFIVNKIELCIQIGDMIKRLHDANVVHADLKPENIIVDISETGKIRSVRLVDLGYGIDLNESPRFSGYRGTIPYVSPEVWRGEPIGKASDMFAFGRIMWGIIQNIHPHHIACQRLNRRMKQKLTQQDYQSATLAGMMPAKDRLFKPTDDTTFLFWQEDFYDLLASMNDAYPQHRITIDNCLARLRLIKIQASPAIYPTPEATLSQAPSAVLFSPASPVGASEVVMKINHLQLT